ncbi:DUF1080 domain-containing protein [bacterium]|nr:DUF1080 domain-containing protein [bacterium]
MLNRRDLLKVSAVTATGSLLAPLGAAESDDASLFDGKSLDGWHPNPKRIGHGTGGRWRVVDGVITGEQEPPGSGNGGLLLTDRQFADFDLTLEMNPDWGPDSGVFFRCTQDGAGFQMYVDYHDSGNVGHLRGEMPGSFAIMPFKIFGTVDGQSHLAELRTGPDPRAEKWPDDVYEYCCTAEDWLRVWKLNDWNTARIRCVGKYPQITTWINGVRLCHFNGETSTLPGYDKERVFGLLGREGSIGLQVHGGLKAWPKGTQCRWRNLRIREL